MTEKKLMEISEQATKKWPLLGSLIIHRYGKLNTSDQIVLAAAASLHRKAAFEATEFMMDYLIKIYLKYIFQNHLQSH